MNGYTKADNLAVDVIEEILIETFFDPSSVEEFDYDTIENKYHGDLQDYIDTEFPDLYECAYDEWIQRIDFTESEMRDILEDFTVDDVRDVLYMYGLENEYDADYVYDHIEPWVVAELYNPIKVSDNWREAYHRVA